VVRQADDDEVREAGHEDERPDAQHEPHRTKFAEQTKKPAARPTKGSGPGDRAEAACCGGTTVGETAALVVCSP
jgi:hypothetical protein